ncbi:MAG: hypothetical protein H6819_02085 [Phycisphaerales bacterium]|nr:hypothetical protein [Phycisphaerales bacterium]MCB9856998.1 hypothetical protein [Phycisphaerales bacterium]MCB9861875.1 hypothetical protein [Phycisphaerales bacterium]
MWWQYLIVAVVVGGCVLYLARGLLLVLFGKSGTSCGGCNCTIAQDAQNPRLGTKRDVVPLGIDRRGDKTGA